MMTASFKIRDARSRSGSRGYRVTAPPSSASSGDAFGDLLHRRRVAARMTQEELAGRAGVSVRTVRDTESGRVRRPRAATVELLAAALGLCAAERRELVELSSREYWTERAPEPNAVGGGRDSRDRQLPATVATFVGREPEIASIVDTLTSAGCCMAVAITGMGGVGKTALAVHVGHLLADRFPDGQLFVDVRGRADHDVLSELAAAVGGPDATLPAEPARAAAQYRSLLAGRRLLIIIDGAAEVGQVAALLPGAPGCAAIITSRRLLSASPHVRQLTLDTVTEPDGVAQLAGIIGRPRVDRELAAAAAVVTRCGHLPLAIQLAGARLVARPRWPIAHLAERLWTDSVRLDELEVGGVSVRACFAGSVDRLAAADPAAARAFGLLGMVGGPDVTTSAAAVILGCSRSVAERTLDRLADANLLGAESPGRYLMHDLLRIYARERVADVAAAPEAERLAGGMRQSTGRVMRLVPRPDALA